MILDDDYFKKLGFSISLNDGKAKVGDFLNDTENFWAH